jgi:tetratricopeptide (TPR) repeat protein
MTTPGSVRRASRVLAGSILLAAGVSLWQIGAPARVAGAQSDLSFISASTWTADPAAGRVHVRAVVTATSHTAVVTGRQYYYDQVQLTLPPSATAFAATSQSGKKLSVAVESVTDASVVVDVALGQHLYSGETGTITLAFDLADEGGSTDRDFRISDNVVSFPVWAFGSPGTSGSSVTVSFPAGFAVQEEFGGLTKTSTGSGPTVFTSGELADATELNAWFTAVRPVAPTDFKVRNIVVGPLDVTLRYWADDVGWSNQVERVLRLGYPLLRSMIGLGDPTGTTLTVEEASTEEIGGYSGAYDVRTGETLISYFADPFVILHELAHMWFNGNLLSDRWTQEGFASYYAEQAVQLIGYADHAPILTDRMRQSAVPLNDWISTNQANSVVDAYLYGASLTVARQIATQAGPSGLIAVWNAARSGQEAYQPVYGGRIESGGGSTDWRRLLDLLEQRTGESFSQLFNNWVVDPSQTVMLQQRDASLSVYSDALKAAGTWNLPPEIRMSLDSWQFAQAVVDTAQARGVLDQRDRIAAESRTEGTTPPSTLQIEFEHSGISTAATEATAELAALDALASARRARSDAAGAARAVGLIGSDPDADLKSAREAFAGGDLRSAESLAADARTIWQNSSGAGQVRILGSLAVLAGGLLLILVMLWNRGVLSRAAARARGMARASDGATAGSAAAATAGATNGATNGATAAAAATNDHGFTMAAAESSARPGDNTLYDEESGAEESAYDLLQRGHSLLRDRHNAQAAVVLERAARLEQSKGSILEALGRAYFNSGQHARAAETFAALLEVDPSAHYGHFGLGLSCARLGRTQEARTHLRLATALDPSSETYRRALDKIEAEAVSPPER